MRKSIVFFILSSLAVITIAPADTIDLPIACSSDDAENNSLTGHVSLTSSDLEILTDEDGPKYQQVGLRFIEVPIPADATITAAWITFTSKNTQSDPVDLFICAEANDNPETFSERKDSLSRRPRMGEMPWNIREEWVKGEKYRTPDISDLIQQVVNRDGWKRNNAIAIFLYDGPNSLSFRNAYSYDGGNHEGNAPVLHVEYEFDQPKRVG
jgi:hypothetical protein